jgi:hypothetical protein
MVAIRFQAYLWGGNRGVVKWGKQGTRVAGMEGNFIVKFKNKDSRNSLRR